MNAVGLSFGHISLFLYRIIRFTLSMQSLHSFRISPHNSPYLLKKNLNVLNVNYFQSYNFYIFYNFFNFCNINNISIFFQYTHGTWTEFRILFTSSAMSTYSNLNTVTQSSNVYVVTLLSYNNYPCFYDSLDPRGYQGSGRY